MKHNMKKSIIMTIIYCMGIGSLTLFIGALYPGKNIDGAAEAIIRENELVLASINSSSDIDDDTERSSSALAFTNKVTPIPTPAISVTPITTPTPEPLPVYEVIVGGYPEIEQFFHDYYVAWNSCDYNLLRTKTTNPDNITPLIDIERETQFIDDIRDNLYYIIKGYKEDTYIVYAYYEIKYVNIKTTLPRLDKFYLVTDEDGEFLICNSEMEEPLKTYFSERDNDETVSWIIEGTNEKAKLALEKDENLRLYVEALYKK